MIYNSKILTVLISFFLISGCDVGSQYGDSCDGIDFSKIKPIPVNIVGLNSTTQTFTIDVEGGVSGFLEKDDKVYYQEYQINVFTKHEPIESTISKIKSLFTIKNAFACSIAPSYISKQKILSIDISSNQGYDPQHPAGSSLKDLFSIKYYIDRNLTVKNIDEFLQSNVDALTNFSLNLTSPPDASNFHSFKITYQLENLDAFEISTEQIFVSLTAVDYSNR